jgi:hypothetical protein
MSAGIERSGIGCLCVSDLRANRCDTNLVQAVEGDVGGLSDINVKASLGVPGDRPRIRLVHDAKNRDVATEELDISGAAPNDGADRRYRFLLLHVQLFTVLAKAATARLEFASRTRFRAVSTKIA